MEEMYKETAAGWAERCRISTQYLRQAAEAAEPDRQAILCKLVEKLFDFQMQPRLDLVRSEHDLSSFDTELRITWSWIIFPLLTRLAKRIG